jgi:transposase-like protein
VAESEVETENEVIRVFPHEQSCLRLIAALLMETSPKWMGRRIYLRMEEPGAATEALVEPA